MEDKAETLILIPSLPTVEPETRRGKEGDSTLQSSLFINPSDTGRGEEGRRGGDCARAPFAARDSLRQGERAAAGVRDWEKEERREVGKSEAL